MCVCLYVCVCRGGLQKHTEILLNQAECGAEELRVRERNKPHITVAVIKTDTS